MSKVKKLVQTRLNELAYFEMLKEDEGLIVDPTLTSISLRVSKDLVKQIDIIANKLELSRSDVVRSFLSASVSEAFQELGMSVEEVLDCMGMLEEKDIQRHIDLQEEYERKIAEQEKTNE